MCTSPSSGTVRKGGGADRNCFFFRGRHSSANFGQFFIPGARSLNRSRKSVPTGAAHAWWGFELVCFSEACRNVLVGFVFVAGSGDGLAFFDAGWALGRARDVRTVGSWMPSMDPLWSLSISSRTRSTRKPLQLSPRDILSEKSL